MNKFRSALSAACILSCVGIARASVVPVGATVLLPASNFSPAQYGAVQASEVLTGDNTRQTFRLRETVVQDSTSGDLDFFFQPTQFPYGSLFSTSNYSIALTSTSSANVSASQIASAMRTPTALKIDSVPATGAVDLLVKTNATSFDSNGALLFGGASSVGDTLTSATFNGAYEPLVASTTGAGSGSTSSGSGTGGSTSSGTTTSGTGSSGSTSTGTTSGAGAITTPTPTSPASTPTATSSSGSGTIASLGGGGSTSTSTPVGTGSKTASGTGAATGSDTGSASSVPLPATVYSALTLMAGLLLAGAARRRPGASRAPVRIRRR